MPTTETIKTAQIKSEITRTAAKSGISVGHRSALILRDAA
jgi:hypothetical protein